MNAKHFLNKPKKFKQLFFNRKMIVTVFQNSRSTLFNEFIEPGTTVKVAIYCDTLHKPRRVTK